jgi:hypothetical protein
MSSAATVVAAAAVAVAIIAVPRSWREEWSSCLHHRWVDEGHFGTLLYSTAYNNFYLNSTTNKP